MDFETVSFVGWFVKDLLSAAGVTPEMAMTWYPVTWWAHALVALVFIAAIPYAKPFHMLSSYANVVTRDEKAGKRLPGVPSDASPDEIGASSIDDFSWKQLLDQDACTKCGRCSSVCPAKASGRPLDPRDVILDLKQYRENLDAGGRRETHHRRWRALASSTARRWSPAWPAWPAWTPVRSKSNTSPRSRR